MQYVADTQKTAVPHIRGLSRELRDDALIMDAATRRNLELEFSLSGHDQHTLAGVMDRAVTSMGSRLLRRWINRPLRDRDVLNLRYQAVEALRAAGAVDPLQDALRAIGDVERILARVALRSARPRDLAQLRDRAGRAAGAKTRLAALRLAAARRADRGLRRSRAQPRAAGRRAGGVAADADPRRRRHRDGF